MIARKMDKVWTAVFYIIATFVVVVLLFLLGEIIKKGWGFWDINFLFGKPSNMQAGGGIGPQLFNSFYILVLTLIISVPIGIGAGIFMAEYAKPGRFLGFLRLCIETLASLPSIVVGLFGLLVFVTMTGWGYTLIGGALAISILNLPSLTRISETALLNVPKTSKEGSLGLGATKWQTIIRISIPAAFPQLITGIILAAGRIFGEAAALIYTAGLTSPVLNSAAPINSPVNPFNIFRPAETLTVHIWKLNSEGIVPDAQLIAAKSAAVLIVMVLLFNLFARVFAKFLNRRFTGANK
ncbi:phosphate ABC transporter permease PstA [Gottfriedia luciferensis]|uniref:phosphate ABC transporter permease PstA n=1 Tax=Gottfriedia luciferensis TaxID=178774 RepID=UPI000B4406FA|nr:phosphate ABC transporter permease PstA [Gottfriedia luciferensis]